MSAGMLVQDIGADVGQGPSRRSPGGTGRIKSIQALRAFAAISVVAYHSCNRLERSGGHVWPGFHTGCFGVDLFFVISGFIMTRIALQNPSADSFIRRRFSRVAPLYWIHTLPWLGLSVLTGRPFLQRLLASIFFWPAFRHGWTRTLLPVGWTLCFEALFYVVVTFSLALGRWVWVLAAAVFVMSFGLAADDRGAVSQFLGNALLLEFGLGAIVAARAVKPRPRLAIAAFCIALTLLGYWAVRGIGPIHDGNRVGEAGFSLVRFVMFGPPSWLIVWSALQLEPWCKGAVIDVLGYLGDASYSLYLAHPIAVLAVGVAWVLFGLPLWALAPAAFAAGLGAGLLSYETIEKPLLGALARRREVMVPVAAT